MSDDIIEEQIPDLEIPEPNQAPEVPELDLNANEHDDNESDEKQTLRISHLRKIERQLKSENSELVKKLANTQSELLQVKSQLSEYVQLFNATYANSTQPTQSSENVYSEGPLTEERIQQIIDNREKAKENAYHAAKSEQEISAITREFQENINQANAKYSDFHEVVLQKGEQFSKTIVDAAMFLPNAGDVLYALAKNPHELQRISGLSTVKQIKTLTAHSNKLAAKVSNSVASSAPSPLSNNLRGKSVTKTSFKGMTPAEIRQFKQAQR